MKFDAKFPSSKDGKIIVNETDDESDNDETNIPEDLYKQSLTSEVSFTRGHDGRVKFLKRKRDEKEDNDDNEKTIGTRWKNKKNRSVENNSKEISMMLGRQYKAKRAGGDVKRPGMDDPYSYIPLSAKIVGNMYFVLIAGKNQLN
jgi:ribosomal RNA-processing protein 12